MPQIARANLDELPLIGSRFPFDININSRDDFADRLRSVIKEQRKQSLEYETIRSQRRAARFDRDIIEQWLESEGFWSYTIDSTFEDNRIQHNIETGPAYRVATLTIQFPNDIPKPNPDSLPLKKGAPLRAADLLAAQQKIRSELQDQQCLYEIQLSYDARINRQTHQAFVTFTLQDSPQVTFGTPQLVGYQDVAPEYLKKFLTFEAGDCFNRKEVEAARLELLQTNLLTRAEPVIAKPENGKVIVTYEVSERSPRTIKAGIGYDTNTGVGYLLSWQHRNLFHHGERLDIEAQTNEIRDSLTSELVKQHFLRKQQTLTLTGEISEETTDAYIYTAGEVGAAIDRPLSRRWAGNLGVRLEYSNDQRDQSQETYTLISTPVILDFNRSNQLLNPTKGWAMSFQLQPFLDLNDTNIQFNKTSVSISAYIGSQSLPARPVLALRWATGSISGEDLDLIPSAHRYYVGGGGSVRGYAYQMVGELEDTSENQNVPTGGLSFSETSAELRLRHSENWGSVLFVDGGYAYPGEEPEFGSEFLWGAGIGIRYFTSFAPIRFDIATPLDTRRDEDGERIDDKIQIYVSIGQAF